MNNCNRKKKHKNNIKKRNNNKKSSNSNKKNNNNNSDNDNNKTNNNNPVIRCSKGTSSEMCDKSLCTYGISHSHPITSSLLCSTI